jgi:hypothetical protein
MTKEQNERLVIAFEKIAEGMTGIHEEIIRAGKRYWPEPGQQREAVLSRVPNEEDEARKRLGISDGPIEDWLDLGDPESEESIGERSAQWIRDHPKEKTKVTDAGAKATVEGQEGGTSTEETESKA